MNSKRIISAFVLMFFLICIAPARSGETVRIGVTLALTGPNSEWGKRTLAGIRMRLHEWTLLRNDPHVELVVMDDGNDPAQSSRNVRELVENKKVMALIGPDLPEFMLAEREYLKEKGVPAISPNATDSGIGLEGDWIFRLMFDNRFQAQVLARYAYDKLNLRRAGAIINHHRTYPEAILEAFRESFEELGGEIVCVESFSDNYNEAEAFDFRGILETMALAKPDLVLLPLLAPTVVDIVNESLKVSLDDAIFMGSDTWESDGLLEAGGNNLRDAYYVSGFNSNSTSPQMEHYRSIYDVSNEAYAALSSVFGYDAMSVILYGVSGADSPAAVRERLYELREYPLATGPITIDRERGTLRPAYVRHVIEEGGFFKSEFEETAWPEDMKRTGAVNR